MASREVVEKVLKSNNELSSKYSNNELSSKNSNDALSSKYSNLSKMTSAKTKDSIGYLQSVNSLKF